MICSAPFFLSNRFENSVSNLQSWCMNKKMARIRQGKKNKTEQIRTQCFFFFFFLSLTSLSQNYRKKINKN